MGMAGALDKKGEKSLVPLGLRFLSGDVSLPPGMALDAPWGYYYILVAVKTINQQDGSISSKKT